MLCSDYLLNIKVLDLSYNNLNDNGLDTLIQDMASLGSTVEELNISGNMISDIEINKISDFIRTGKLRRLSNVIAQDCKITDAGYRALKIAMMKAESFKGDQKVQNMMAAAKARDQAELEGDV